VARYSASAFLERAHDGVDVLLIALDHLVFHRESGAWIDGAFLRHQIPNVTVGGEDFKVLAGGYFLMVFALAGDSTITRFELNVFVWRVV